MTMTATATQRSLAELIDELSRFDGPPEQFLLNMLIGQCHIARASSGAILRLSQGGPEILALYPALSGREPTPVWLSFACDMTARVCKQAMTLVTPLRVPDQLYEEAPRK